MPLADGEYQAVFGSGRFKFAALMAQQASEVGVHFNRVRPASEWWKRDLRVQNPLARSQSTERECMTDQIDILKAVLWNKRSELAWSIRSRSSQLSIGEVERELMDRIQGMSTREEAVTYLDILNRNLAAVDTALQAMEEGSYGTCADCGEPIAVRRLKAIPWASRCIRCQGMHDCRHIPAEIPHWNEAA